MELAEEILFLKQENWTLEAEVQDGMGVIAMAVTLVNDPEDRLGLKEIWLEKALKLVGEYNARKRGNTGGEVRHTDWVGD